ncbi:MAG: polymer-forming cytoskeletal protein [Dehalococcoidia bacterium]
MSFFGGNSSRPATGREDEDRGPTGETTFLGDAAALPQRAPSPSRNLLDTEPKPVDSGLPTRTSGLPSAPGSAPSPAGPTPPDRCANVIAAGAKWQGTLNVDDSVRIEGQFSGEVRAKGTVHVSEGAQVDAKIRALFVVVSGNVRGEIRCEQRVDLLPRSRVNGQVITKVLSIHEGAVLDGSVQMSSDGTSVDVTSSAPAASRSSRSASAERATSGIARNGE